MTQYRYLRAYMAGIVVPTMFLLVVMFAFTIARYVFNVPIAIERIIVFPMAVIPNLWGLWNMLFMRLRGWSPLSLGVHGALLVLLIVPLGALVAKLLGVDFPRDPLAIIGPAAAAAVYYLVWKHVVGFLNRSLGIS